MALVKISINRNSISKPKADSDYSVWTCSWSQEESSLIKKNEVISVQIYQVCQIKSKEERLFYHRKAVSWLHNEEKCIILLLNLPSQKIEQFWSIKCENSPINLL